MQLSLFWLNELLDLRIFNLKFFIKRLTINGFEVENCVLTTGYKKTTLSLKISIPSNRGDVNSIRAIAKEVILIIDRVKYFRYFIHYSYRENTHYTSYIYNKALRLHIAPPWSGLQVHSHRQMWTNVALFNRTRVNLRRIQKGFFYVGNHWRYANHVPNKPIPAHTDVGWSPRYIAKKILDLDFKWPIENVVFRSNKWKCNRDAGFKPTIFNSEHTKLYSKFICWIIKDL